MLGGVKGPVPITLVLHLLITSLSPPRWKTLSDRDHPVMFSVSLEPVSAWFTVGSQ